MLDESCGNWASVDMDVDGDVTLLFLEDEPRRSTA